VGNAHNPATTTLPPLDQEEIAMRPALYEPSSHRTVALFGVQFAYRLETANTDGLASVLEVTVPPRTLVKPHQHSREDEFSLILSGTVGARIGDETYEEIPAGSSVVKPRDIPHAMWNVTDEPARILEIVMPAGLEAYFTELEPILHEQPQWTERFYELATRFGLTILDDWSRELQERYGITL
jgi:quercetin dioxygenase-like cupin family protein